MFAALVWALALGQVPPSAFEPVLYPQSPAAIPSPEPSLQHAFLLQFDMDQNGVLTLEELPEQLRKRFDRADLNRDGKLDARELLVGPTRISREARRAEDLHFGRAGLTRRVARGDHEMVPFRIGTEILRRMDRNGDGWVDGTELGSLLQQPGIIFGDPQRQPVAATAVASAEAQLAVPQPAQVGVAEALPGQAPLAPSEVAAGVGVVGPRAPVMPQREDIGEAISSRTEVAESTTVAPQPVAAGESAASAGAARTGAEGQASAGLPDAPTILANLDKNGNGQLDRDEAVDQLADNFDRLDKNRDNMLSEQEIKRGLFLARMFGIKPKQDPRTYRKE